MVAACWALLTLAGCRDRGRPRGHGAGRRRRHARVRSRPADRRGRGSARPAPFRRSRPRARKARHGPRDRRFHQRADRSPSRRSRCARPSCGPSRARRGSQRAGGHAPRRRDVRAARPRLHGADVAVPAGSAARASSPGSSCSSSSSSWCRSPSSSPRSSGAERFPPQLLEAVSVLALTPLGAAWAYPGLVALGDSECAGCRCSSPWEPSSVSRSSGRGSCVASSPRRSVPPPAASAADSAGSASRPARPAARSSARSLIYWFRDRRYVVNVLVIPIAAAITAVPLLIAGVPLEIVALVPVPFAALFLGWLPHNDVAYDSTAVWMHIASGVRGWSDRIGRLVPVLLIGLPLLALAIPFAILLLRPVGAPPGSGGRLHLALPLRTRALEHRVGRCAVRRVAAGRESVRAAAAHRRRRSDRPGRRHDRHDRPERAGAVVGLDRPHGRHRSGDARALGRARRSGSACSSSASRSEPIVFERRGGRLMEFAESTDGLTPPPVAG